MNVNVKWNVKDECHPCESNPSTKKQKTTNMLLSGIDFLCKCCPFIEACLLRGAQPEGLSLWSCCEGQTEKEMKIFGLFETFDSA